MLHNVLDYASDGAGISLAIAAASPGDRIYIPGTQIYQAPVGGWIIDKSLEIFGDGPGKSGSYSGTVLTPAGITEPMLLLDPQANASHPDVDALPNVFIHDLALTRRSNQSGLDGNSAIQIKSGAPGKVGELRLERLRISHLASAGIRLVGGDHVVSVYMQDCDVSYCGLQGILLAQTYQFLGVRSRFAHNNAEGLLCQGAEVVVYACTFEHNRRASTPTRDADLVLRECILARIDACQFIDFDATPAVACHLLDCGGSGSIGGSTFFLSAPHAGSIGIRILGDASGAMLVLPNRLANVEMAVNIGKNASAYVVFPQISDTDSGATTNLPTSDQFPTLAVPSRNSEGGAAWSGMLIPFVDKLPNPTDTTYNVRPGMLVAASGVRDEFPPGLYLYTDGTNWREVSLDPPLG